MREETNKLNLNLEMTGIGNNFIIRKDLAISISLEAAELLEVFQWSGADVSNEGKQDKIKEELADVVNYCVLMADACELDLDEIVQEKIKINERKYPVEKAKEEEISMINFKLRNEALAHAFAYMNMIQHWGSGIPRIIDKVKAAGLQEPEFIGGEVDLRINIY